MLFLQIWDLIENGLNSYYLSMVFWRSYIISVLPSIFALVLQSTSKFLCLSPLQVTSNKTSCIPFILEVGGNQLLPVVCYMGKLFSIKEVFWQRSAGLKFAQSFLVSDCRCVSRVLLTQHFNFLCSSL